MSEDIFELLIDLFPLEIIREKVIPVGWSLGGCVCMQLVIYHHDVFSRLILIASAGIHGHKFMKEDHLGNKLNLIVESKEEMRNHSKIMQNMHYLLKGDYEFYRGIFCRTLMNSGRIPPNIDMLGYLGDVFR